MVRIIFCENKDKHWMYKWALKGRMECGKRIPERWNKWMQGIVRGADRERAKYKQRICTNCGEIVSVLLHARTSYYFCPYTIHFAVMWRDEIVLNWVWLSESDVQMNEKAKNIKIDEHSNNTKKVGFALKCCLHMQTTHFKLTLISLQHKCASITTPLL